MSATLNTNLDKHGNDDKIKTKQHTTDLIQIQHSGIAPDHSEIFLSFS